MSFTGGGRWIFETVSREKWEFVHHFGNKTFLYVYREARVWRGRMDRWVNTTSDFKFFILNFPCSVLPALGDKQPRKRWGYLLPTRELISIWILVKRKDKAHYVCNQIKRLYIENTTNLATGISLSMLTSWSHYGNISCSVSTILS